MNSSKLLTFFLLLFAVCIAVGTLFFLWASMNVFGLTLKEIRQEPFLNPYTLYTIGEIIALVGLLSICIPIIFQLSPAKAEIFKRRNLLFLLLMLIVLSLAYSVRIPAPNVVVAQGATQIADKQSLLIIGYHAQLMWQVLMGLLVSVLGMMSLSKKWPRTLIILLLMYFVYFSTGTILLSEHLIADMTSFVIFGLMIAFILLLSILALSKPDTSPTAKQPAIEASEERAKIEAEAKANKNQKKTAPQQTASNDKEGNDTHVFAMMHNLGDMFDISSQLKSKLESNISQLQNLRTETEHVEADKKQQQANHDEIMEKLDTIEKHLHNLELSQL